MPRAPGLRLWGPLLGSLAWHAWAEGDPTRVCGDPDMPRKKGTTHFGYTYGWEYHVDAAYCANETLPRCLDDCRARYWACSLPEAEGAEVPRGVFEACLDFMGWQEFAPPPPGSGRAAAPRRCEATCQGGVNHYAPRKCDALAIDAVHQSQLASLGGRPDISYVGRYYNLTPMEPNAASLWDYWRRPYFVNMDLDEIWHNDTMWTLHWAWQDYCVELSRHVNCGCSDCDSFKLICGCRVPSFPRAESTCRDASGRSRAAVLEGEACELRCQANATARSADQPRCWDGRFGRRPEDLLHPERGLAAAAAAAQDAAPDWSGEAGDEARPAFACDAAPPAPPCGHLAFVDEDPRPALLSGVLVAALAERAPDVAGFAVYWGRNASERLEGTGRVATLAVPPGATRATGVLRGVEVPASAFYLLAHAENAAGEAATEPWPLPVFDLFEDDTRGDRRWGVTVEPLLGRNLSEQLRGRNLPEQVDAAWLLCSGRGPCNGSAAVEEDGEAADGRWEFLFAVDDAPNATRTLYLNKAGLTDVLEAWSSQGRCRGLQDKETALLSQAVREEHHSVLKSFNLSNSYINSTRDLSVAFGAPNSLSPVWEGVHYDDSAAPVALATMRVGRPRTEVRLLSGAGPPQGPVRLKVGSALAVLVSGRDLPGPGRAWLVLAPAGANCSAGSYVSQRAAGGGAAHGLLQAGASSERQQWAVRLPVAGSFQVCWEGCRTAPWAPDAACEVAVGAQEVLAESCQASLLGDGGRCLEASEDACSLAGGEVVDAEPCRRLLRSPEGDPRKPSPLVALNVTAGERCRSEEAAAAWDPTAGPRTADEVEGQGWSLSRSRRADDGQVSMDVSPDGSYLLLVRPFNRTVQVVPLVPLGNALPAWEVGRSGEACEEMRQEVVEARRDHWVRTFPSSRPFQPPQSCGDGGPASEARFILPVAVRVAPSGAYCLVVDAFAHRVRRINVATRQVEAASTSTWTIETVVGSAQQVEGLDPGKIPAAYRRFRKASGLPDIQPDILEGGFTGDGGPATLAGLNLPHDVAILGDDAGTFLIADRMNHRVRRVRDGVITTVAGSGPIDVLPEGCHESPGHGNGGPATEARLLEPTGVEYVPGGSGAFVVAEHACHRIRWVDACGSIRLLVGATSGLRWPVQPRITAAGRELLVAQAQADGSGAEQRHLHSVRLPAAAISGDCDAPADGAADVAVESLGFTSEDGLHPGESPEDLDWSVAGLAVGPNGTIYLQASDEGSVWKISRQNLTCTHEDFTFNCNTTACLCKEGKYATQGPANATFCERCSPRHYCSQGVERTCPHVMTTFRKDHCPNNKNLLEDTVELDTYEATSEDDCACVHGLIRWPESEPICEDCPEGLLCPAGWRPGQLAVNSSCGAASRLPLLRNGYYAQASQVAADGGYEVFSCERESHCWWTTYAQLWRIAAYRGCRERDGPEHCAAQGGLTGGCHGGGACAAMRRAGLRCGRCSQGHFEDTSGQCVSCESGGFLATGLAALAGLTFLTLFYAFLNNPRGAKSMATYMVSMAASSLVDFVGQYNLLRMIDIMPQIPRLDELAYALSWLLDHLQVKLVPINCMWGNPASLRYPLAVAFPPILVATFAALWLLFAATASLRARLPADPPACLPLGRLRPHLKSALAALRTFRMERDKIINTVGFILVASYVFIVRTSFVPFQLQGQPRNLLRPNVGADKACADGGLRWGCQSFTLWRYPDVALLTKEWFEMLPWGVASILVFTVGIYVFHIVITCSAPQRFSVDAAFRTRHRYFYGKFRDDRYYWGVVGMTKGLLTNFVGLLNPIIGGFLQTQIIITLNIVFVLLLFWLRPYKIHLNSLLDVMLALTLASIMIMNPLSTASDTLHNEQDFLHLPAILASPCALALAFLAGSVLRMCLFAQSCDTRREEIAVRFAFMLKSWSGRVLQITRPTLLSVVKAFSPSERRFLYKGLRFLESGLASVRDSRLAEAEPEFAEILVRLSVRVSAAQGGLRQRISSVLSLDSVRVSLGALPALLAGRVSRRSASPSGTCSVVLPSDGKQERESEGPWEEPGAASGPEGGKKKRESDRSKDGAGGAPSIMHASLAAVR